MKVIDLLNKIANGEEVPNEFIYNGCLYENYQNGCYRHYDTENKLINNFVRQLCDDFCNLNDEVEIIEEAKKVEHINKIYDITSFKNDYEEAAKLLKDTSDKLYEVIDEINKLKENK